MQKVIDAYALLCYLNKESGWEQVEEMLSAAAEKGRNLLMSAVNWGEVCYIIKRNYSPEETESIMQLIDTFPIDLIPADREQAKTAAQFKAGGKISYADCFAAALAKLRKAELVTGDKEFKMVENEIKIRWLL
ncbi:MAG: type II toxin-antitoxin system VapC family toxin [Planctomycetota bacterium]